MCNVCVMVFMFVCSSDECFSASTVLLFVHAVVSVCACDTMMVWWCVLCMCGCDY